jgi:hypothetical protein
MLTKFHVAGSEEVSPRHTIWEDVKPVPCCGLRTGDTKADHLTRCETSYMLQVQHEWHQGIPPDKLLNQFHVAGSEQMTTRHTIWQDVKPVPAPFNPYLFPFFSSSLFPFLCSSSLLFCVLNFQVVLLHCERGRNLLWTSYCGPLELDLKYLNQNYVF